MLDKLRQGAGALKTLNRLRQIQKQLSQQRVTVEEAGVQVTVSGDLKIKELKTNGADDEKITKAVNKALEQAQKEVAKRMQELGGGLGLLKGL